MSTVVSEMQNELRMFWRLSSEVEGLASTGGSDALISETLDEIKALGEYSVWPSLKARIDHLLKRHAYARKSAPEGMCVS